jgi:ABC-type uncharacterized transport system permease subunit
VRLAGDGSVAARVRDAFRPRTQPVVAVDGVSFSIALITFALYPEPMFGGLLRLVLFTIVPAGFVGDVPARLVHDPSVGHAMLMVAAAAVHLAAAGIVFERGLRRYGSGGRFTTFG